MVYRRTTLIGEELEKAGLKYSIKETNNMSYTESGVSGKGCTYQVRFISADENNVKALSSEFAKFPEDKMDAGYKMLNEFNRTYRFVKFTMDPNDGAVSIQCDLPVSLDDDVVGKVAVELLIRFMGIIDDAYPEIMRSIWA